MTRTRATSANLLEEFLDMMSAERGASRNTLEAYRRDLIDFDASLRGRSLRDTTRDDVKTYLANLSASGNFASSTSFSVSSYSSALLP